MNMSEPKEPQVTEEEGKEKKGKKLKLDRVEMPRQEPEVRRRNFDEVALGYTYDMAMYETSRCIQCKKRNCQAGCPVNIDIPDFIAALAKGDIEGASRILKAKTSLPGICGRVCPQETQCEGVCTLNKKGAPIAIGRLERYIADWERAEGIVAMPEIAPSTGKRVAVVGTGPSGLTVASDMAIRGHEVTVFEALHVAGGVLMYGIPEFRLPKEIVNREVDYVKSLGVNIQLNTLIGINFSLDELLNTRYDAVYLATGAGLPMFLKVPGENLNMVYSANEFLTRTVLMKSYLYPTYATPIKMGRKVAVIGGGNVAMDAARCAIRLGAQEVNVIYRRSREEMPARLEEVENAEEEGIHFHFLCAPTAFLSDGRGNVSAMELIRMTLGEPDASGRRRPVPQPGSEFVMDVDTAVVSLGTSPNPLIASTTPDLEVTRWGTVVIDERGKTSKARVWAGGDIVSGGATVISAMGEGRIAAEAMHEVLTNGAKKIIPPSPAKE
jgi:glutamate synthase (NADPH/NADH) small chain